MSNFKYLLSLFRSAISELTGWDDKIFFFAICRPFPRSSLLQYLLQGTTKSVFLYFIVPSRNPLSFKSSRRGRQNLFFGILSSLLQIRSTSKALKGRHNLFFSNLSSLPFTDNSSLVSALSNYTKKHERPKSFVSSLTASVSSISAAPSLPSSAASYLLPSVAPSLTTSYSATPDLPYLTASSFSLSFDPSSPARSLITLAASSLKASIFFV